MIFFFNDPATTEIYTLSLHDALPISPLAITSAMRTVDRVRMEKLLPHRARERRDSGHFMRSPTRSEEHTSELQSPDHLVCRLLLEKKSLNIRHNLSSSKRPKPLHFKL